MHGEGILIQGLAQTREQLVKFLLAGEQFAKLRWFGAFFEFR